MKSIWNVTYFFKPHFHFSHLSGEWTPYNTIIQRNSRVHKYICMHKSNESKPSIIIQVHSHFQPKDHTWVSSFLKTEAVSKMTGPSFTVQPVQLLLIST